MVECMIWDHDAAGSSPVSPTIQTHTANLKIQSLCYWFESNYAAFRVLINWQIKRMINVSSLKNWTKFEVRWSIYLYFYMLIEKYKQRRVFNYGKSID